MKDITQVLMTVVLSTLLLISVFKFVPGFAPTAQTPMVTIDVIKVMNAQRRIAEGIAQNNLDNTVLIANLGKYTQRAIREVAGDGTIVLVKQAVVDSNIPDITDDVLQMLDLETDVPGLDIDTMMEKGPVTSFSKSPEYQSGEEAIIRYSENYFKSRQKQSEEKTQDLLPY